LDILSSPFGLAVSYKELQREIQKIKEIGIEVKYKGKGLTHMLKGGWTTLTFKPSGQG